MNALVKINKRAKQIRKANKKMSHTDAVKKASAEYRAGKLGSTAKTKTVKVSRVGKIKKSVKRGKVAKVKVKISGISKQAVNRGGTGMPIISGFFTKRSDENLSALKQAKNKLLQIDAQLWQMRKTSKAGKSITELKTIHSRKNELLKERKIWKKNLGNLKQLI